MRTVLELALAVCAGLRCESAGEEKEADGEDAHFGLVCSFSFFLGGLGILEMRVRVEMRARAREFIW